jgi:hypothetical protein
MAVDDRRDGDGVYLLSDPNEEPWMIARVRGILIVSLVPCPVRTIRSRFR